MRKSKWIELRVSREQWQRTEMQHKEGWGMWWTEFGSCEKWPQHLVQEGNRLSGHSSSQLWRMKPMVALSTGVFLFPLCLWDLACTGEHRKGCSELCYSGLVEGRHLPFPSPPSSCLRMSNLRSPSPRGWAVDPNDISTKKGGILGNPGVSERRRE